MSKGNFSIASGEMTLTAPKSKTGFPIGHADWDLLKKKVRLLKKGYSLLSLFKWREFGMLFIGVAITTLISFWLPGYENADQKNIVRIITSGMFFLGACFLFFDYCMVKKDEFNANMIVENIIEWMDFLESDYPKHT